MPIPPNLRAIDLMLEIPRAGNPSVALGPAQRLMKDEGSKEYSAHPAEYLFKGTAEEMSRVSGPEQVVALMDQFGVEMGQIDVAVRKPERTIEIFEQFPGRFFGSVTIDPNDVMGSVRLLKRLVGMHPNIRAAAAGPCLYHPQVAIDDPKMYPIYAACVELDIPISILTGVPGPRVPFGVQTPDRFDIVCYDFPELKVVMRHCGEPWVDLCVKLMLKWPNLYYSTSAFAPKHYPKEAVDFANSRGSDKVMFAGYYPGLTFERVFGELDAHLELHDEVWPKFLRENAVKVFGLDEIAG